MIRTGRSTTTCRRSALEGCRRLQSQNVTWPRTAVFSLPDGIRIWLRNELGPGTGLQLQPGIAIGDRPRLRKHLATRAPASGLAQCKALYACVKAFAHGVARPICAREPGPRAFLRDDADVVPLSEERNEGALRYAVPCRRRFTSIASERLAYTGRTRIFTCRSFSWRRP